MLILKDVSVRLGSRPVLHQIDFATRPGSLTAIVGPNGSGKTTLLRAMTGDLAYAGSILLNDAEVCRAKPWQLAAMRGVLSQSTQLAFPFTVMEVVGLGLQSGNGAGRAQLPALALQEVGLSGYGPRGFHDLSGGEQARVHLARVLAQVWEPVTHQGPRWLFLDEPVSSLDIGHQLLVMRLARRFADAGGGVVAVMHDLNLTAMFADTVALMSEGRIVMEGKPDVVLTNAHLSAAYHCSVRVNTPPVTGPWILPQATQREAG